MYILGSCDNKGEFMEFLVCITDNREAIQETLSECPLPAMFSELEKFSGKFKLTT